ncbi:hypothetical protein ABE347_06605 [Bacillus paralicheniformis]|uniref:hypothetical protein n=1 Tax=Bacillus paralicheniformis TaxID=1648923 RepID=UPI003D1A3A49
MLRKDIDLYEFARKKVKELERLTITKYELSEDKDHIDVTYILASSVENANGALITKEEMESAKDSIIHQPLIIVPDWDDLPTGHSLEEFPKLSWGALIIGTHISSDIVQDGDIYHLTAKARVWKIRYPEVAANIIRLHEAGTLKFSMESRYTSQTIEGATRTLHGVRFIGSAVVDDPANPFSYALEVARKEKTKEEKVVNFEQAMQKLKELDADAYLIVNEEFTSLNDQVGDKEKLETASNELKNSLKTANEKIDELTNELNSMKEEKAQTELAQKQEARFNAISEFIEFAEDEIECKKEAFGKMDEDTFALVLETAKRNKKEKKESNVEFASDTKLEVQNGFLDGLGE